MTTQSQERALLQKALGFFGNYVWLNEAAQSRVDGKAEELLTEMAALLSTPPSAAPAENEDSALLDALDKAESQCLGAVGYVGAANYESREREAKQMVREAFGTIYAAMKGQA